MELDLRKNLVSEQSPSWGSGGKNEANTIKRGTESEGTVSGFSLV